MSGGTRGTRITSRAFSRARAAREDSAKSQARRMPSQTSAGDACPTATSPALLGDLRRHICAGHKFSTPPSSPHLLFLADDWVKPRRISTKLRRRSNRRVSTWQITLDVRTHPPLICWHGGAVYLNSGVGRGGVEDHRGMPCLGSHASLVRVIAVWSYRDCRVIGTADYHVAAGRHIAHLVAQLAPHRQQQDPLVHVASGRAGGAHFREWDGVRRGDFVWSLFTVQLLHRCAISTRHVPGVHHAHPPQQE